MELNYKKLGGYIRQIDLRNKDASLGEENLYGISVTKEFIISHANLVGVTFDSYKVVAPRQFAYIPDTSRRGDKIAISLNTFGEDIIVSSICSVFEIIDENQLLPEYLMLWFMRPEFDRYARFMSNGSAREVFDWDCMCGVELPVPSISEQRKIVHDYQVITDRIELFNKMDAILKEHAQCIYKETFEGADSENWEKKKLGDYLSLERGLSYKGEFLSDSGVPMINLGNILPNSTYRPEKLKFYTGDYAKRHIVNVGDILVANTDLTSAREVIGSAIRVPLLKTSPIICSHHISIVRNCKISKYFILGLFNRPTFRERVKGFATGTTVYAIPTETILNFEVNIPPKNVMAKYEEMVVPLYAYMDVIQAETWFLNTLKDKLLERISYA